MAHTTSRSKRKYVTTACHPCRESKVKCDGEKPFCSNCRNKRRNCHYKIGPDKRNLRFAVALLVSRVGALSQFIIDQGFIVPPMVTEDQVALESTLDVLGLSHVKASLERSKGGEKQRLKSTFPHATQSPCGGLTSPTNGAETARSNLILQDNPSSLSITSHGIRLATLPKEPNSTPPIHEVPISALPKQRAPSTNPARPQGELSNPSNNNLEELVRQLSDRMGSLQAGSDGKLRYYGPTSNFNLLHMPTPDNLTVHRTIRRDGQNTLRLLGLDRIVPRSLEDHLISLYFVWENPASYIVDRKMYETARVKWRDHLEETPYYSEALTNAICCLGAAFEPRYHPDFITYPRSLSDFFADRTKALLDIELDSPCVATVQAMVVLSGHDIGCKRDARGWLYSGMAMRLAFDLGLHVDMKSHVEEGSISAMEAEVRRVVFWASYTVDQNWGFLLGRPLRIYMDDVTVAKPDSDMVHGSQQTWSAYALPARIGLLERKPIKDPVLLLNKSRVLLCEITAPLSYTLYGSSTISQHDLWVLNNEMTEKLLGWKSSLPKELQFDYDNTGVPVLPHLVLLHMHYHQACIQVQRPWMSKQCLASDLTRSDGELEARISCVKSAFSIAKCLHLYEVQYSFQRMNIEAVAITCSAALMLIFATTLDHRLQDKQQASKYLNVCFRALEEFGPSWESARRAQTFLLRMQRLWEARVEPRPSRKRDIPQTRNEASVKFAGPKRNCTSGSFGKEHINS